MAADRQPKMRAMIMAETEEERRAALDELLPLQQEDFEGLFEEMERPAGDDPAARPAAARVPARSAEDVAQEVERARIEQTDDLEELEHTLDRIHSLAETNPMLGTRGVRLGVLHPEIYEMQVARDRARAALRERPEPPQLEIMIPLVAYERELELMRELVERVAEEEGGAELDFSVGTMIELPRACFVADRIAEHADFFSFGTNDLTQTALGFSRDDVEGELPATATSRRKILDRSPFETIDTPGRRLARAAGARGSGARRKPDLKLGICGEHGGDPDSIAFFHMAGLDYVSCSPYRVPIARVAAAQASAHG